MLRALYLIFLLVLYVLGGSVVLANDKTFKEVVHDSNKYTFVEFYADWCRHCGKLSPVLDTVASMFDNEPNVQIVKVNGDKDGVLSWRQ